MASLLPAMRRVARTFLMLAIPAVVLAAMLPATAIAASPSGANRSTGYYKASGQVEQVGRGRGGRGYGGRSGRRPGYGNAYGGRAGYGQGNYSRSGYGNRSSTYCNIYGKSNYGRYSNVGYGRRGYGYRMGDGYGSYGYGYGHGGNRYSNYDSSGYGSDYTSTGSYATGTYKLVVYPAQPAAQAGAVTLQLSSNDALGEFLVGPNGMTLYTFDRDTPNQSVCTDACAQAWPPLTVAAGTAPVAVDGVNGKLGVITRLDGSWQVTYNDRPLYYYAQDQRVGDTTGNGVEGVWHVAAP